MKLYFKTEDCLLFLRKGTTINLYFLFLALKEKKADIVYFYVGLTMKSV